MKKLLLSSFCICMLSAGAQITLNTSDVGAINKVIFNATDTMPTISIGSAGASQSWNMTALSADIQDTITFLPYSSAPNSNFSTANLIMKIGNMVPAYVYAINSASSLTILGYNAMLGASTVTPVNTPAETVMNFPTTYNSTFTNNYKTYQKFYFGQLGVDSVRQNTSIKKTVLADAWGNLTTPYGTYPVLRAKETKITHDTLDGLIAGTWYNAIVTTADSTTSYIWWAKTIGFPLVKAVKDSSNAVVSVEWLSGISAVGISEHITPEGINVYPNPAQNEIHFTINTSKEAKSIQVFDLTGRMIHEHPVKNDRSTINTSHFADGVYIYSILGEENVILDQGKFTVAR